MSEGMNKQRIPRRILLALLSSLSAGVVPRAGAPFVAIGRDEELSLFLRDLDALGDRGSFFRFVIGKYGSGKSFLIQLMRVCALEKGFVCADADLSPEKRICGTKGSGLATYRELMKNLSVKTSPDGGALPIVISKWISSLKSQTAADGFSPDSDDFEKELSRRIYGVAGELESAVGGFDFANVIKSYYLADRGGDEEKKSACIRWLRGEFNTRTEAKKCLAVSDIIHDGNWFDYIKLLALFVRKAGYGGLTVFLDECVNLYKIPNRVARESNYEKLLAMYNDTLQGGSESLGIVMGGTPQFLEDRRRGLFSYEALRSRLEGSRFESGEYKNIMGPVIRLRRLSDGELLALIARVTRLHGDCYEWTPRVEPSHMEAYLRLCLERVGADSMITPREIIRDYLSLLNILLQNEDADMNKLLLTCDGPVSDRKAEDELTEGEKTVRQETPASSFSPEDIEF
ncbi:MAG: biotin carboxylase [Ruminococcaceae bacterium]|nr:biotin carboxylase [Oscillospiraceae bacterium]